MEKEKNIEQSLRRPDIYTAGKFEGLQFQFQNKPNQKIQYVNFAVGPKRPIEDFESYDRFYKSVHAAIAGNTMGKIPTLRNNFLEFGTVRRLELLNIQVNPDTGFKKEELKMTEVSIYPNMHIAWVIGEYNKAQERNLVDSSWNPLELLKHGVTVNLLTNKRKLKRFAYDVYEQNLFQLLDQKAASNR